MRSTFTYNLKESKIVSKIVTRVSSSSDNTIVKVMATIVAWPLLEFGVEVTVDGSMLGA